MEDFRNQYCLATGKALEIRCHAETNKNTLWIFEWEGSAFHFCSKKTFHKIEHQRRYCNSLLLEMVETPIFLKTNNMPHDFRLHRKRARGKIFLGSTWLTTSCKEFGVSKPVKW